MNRNRIIHRGCFVFFFILIAGMYISCGERSMDVSVRLVTQTCDDGAGSSVNVLRGVRFLEFVVSGDGIDEPLKAYGTVGEGRAIIPDIPVTGSEKVVRRRIDVLAREHVVTGPVVARGAAVIEISDEDKAIDAPIFIRQVDGFSLTSSAFEPETCSGMNRQRAGHTATVLPDGRVLIVGGAVVRNDARTVHKSAEIYDPKTGEFQLIEGESGLHQPRVFHTATLLRDGRVLVAGGEYDPPDGGTPQVNRSAEIFDWRTESFSTPIQLPRARTRHTATAASGDMVLLAGGYSDLSIPSGKNHPVPNDTTDIFHAAGDLKDTFTEGVDLPDPRAEHCAVSTLGGSRVVLSGGKTVNNSEVVAASTIRYLAAWPNDSRFSLLGELAYLRNGRYGHGCGVMRNVGGAEIIVMTGGFRKVEELDGPFGEDSAMAGNEIFDPGSSQTALEMDSLPRGARGHICSVMSDGEMFVFGGKGDGSADASAMADRLFSGETGPEVVRVEKVMNDGRYYHRCTALLDGSILITGGQYSMQASDDDILSLSSAEIFTPVMR